MATLTAPPAHEPLLEQADIFFTRGHSLVSRAIRWFTRRLGEKRTQVNHVGVVVSDGPPDDVLIIEALSKVRKHKLIRYATKQDEVAVFRAIDLSEEDKRVIVDAALDYEGRSYGWDKIVAHFLDWMLFGAYFFRRFARMDEYPICSWLVAHSFKKAGRDFGVPPGAADPDDIWDFSTANPDRFDCIRPLSLMTPPAGASIPDQAPAATRNP